MLKFATVLLATSLLVGCGGSAASVTSPVAPVVTPSPVIVKRITGSNGRLVSSPTGEISIVDGEPPAGFTALANVTVTALDTGLSTLTDGSGYFELATPPGVMTLRVDPAGTLLQVPSFSAEAEAPIALALFPDNVSLLTTQTLAMRAVGRDARGRFAPLDPAGITWDVDEVDRDPEIPDTNPSDDPQFKTLSNEVVGGLGDGSYTVRATGYGLAGRGGLVEADSLVTGSVVGQVLQGGTPVAGATVKVVGGSFQSVTDSQGNYNLPALPALVHNLVVATPDHVIGTAVVGVQAGRQIVHDIPTLNMGYTRSVFATLAAPSGMAVDPSQGKLYVCDGDAVKVFSTATGQPDPPLGQQFGKARAVAVAFDGTLAVTDVGQNELRLISLTKDQKFTERPDLQGVGADSAGDFYADSFTNNQIVPYRFDQDAAGFKAGEPFGKEVLHSPQGLAINRFGDIFVADRTDGEIEVFNLKGQATRSWKLSEGSFPREVALDLASNLYVLTDTEVLRYTSGGVFVGRFGGPFQDPLGITVDAQGNVYVADGTDVVRFTPDQGPPTLQAPPLPAPTGISLLTDQNFVDFEQKYQQLMQRFDIPGSSFSLSVGGKLLVHRGYGYGTQSSTQSIPVQPDDMFRLASCSKSFAAVTLLDQFESQPTPFAMDTLVFAPGGVLASLTPGSPADNRINLISVQNLLQMTAGLNDDNGLYAPLARTLGGSTPPATAVQILVHILTTGRLSFDPGTKYIYSDVAYLTLGRVVEAVEGTPNAVYGDVLQARLLGPVGLGRVQVSNTNLDGTAPNEVRYYPAVGQSNGQSIFTNDPLIVSPTYGAVWYGVAHDSAGGLISSSGDMVKLLNAVGPNGAPGFVRPLTNATVDMMTAAPPFDPTSTSYFGMGFDVTSDGQGNITSLSKDGALPGTMTFMLYEPQTQVAWAIVYNSRPGPSTRNSGFAIGQFKLAVKNLVQQESGNWPAGDLFPIP